MEIKKINKWIKYNCILIIKVTKTHKTDMYCKFLYYYMSLHQTDKRILTRPMNRDPFSKFLQSDLFIVNVNVNVTDTILWQGHHDRVMQLN